MENQITNEQQTVGKTIAHVEMTFSGWMGLRFTDGTFILFDTHSDYDDGSDICVQEEAPDAEQQRDLELLSYDDYKAICKKRTAEAAAKREAAERAEFERLSAKFAAVQAK